MTSSGDLSSVGRFSLVAGVAALLCLAAPEIDSAGAEDREQAAVTSPAGVIGLPRGAGRVRVRISATAQPLLRAATAPPVRRLLRPAAASPRVQSGIVPIGASERRAARRNEAAYEAAISGVEAEARSQRRHLARIAAAVRRRGGAVREVELVPGAVVASLSRSRARSMARLPYVQAVEGVTRPRSLSGIGTSAIGAPSWWAAGLTGGTGPADTVPADAAIESEAADPAHPAFAGIDVDNDPTQSVTDHGTHTGGIIASGDATYPGVAYGVDRLLGSGSSAYLLGNRH